MNETDCGFTTDKKWFRYRAAAVIIENGCILMAKNTHEPHYYSVGGGVHCGETAEAAVIREVFEETGVHYDADRLIFIHENFFKGKGGSIDGLECHEVTLYFLMKPRGTQQLDCHSLTSEGFEEKMVWLPIDKYDTYFAYPEFFGEKLKNLPDLVEHIVTIED